MFAKLLEFKTILFGEDLNLFILPYQEAECAISLAQLTQTKLV